jgi:hypothetical protein
MITIVWSAGWPGFVEGISYEALEILVDVEEIVIRTEAVLNIALLRNEVRAVEAAPVLGPTITYSSASRR